MVTSAPDDRRDLIMSDVNNKNTIISIISLGVLENVENVANNYGNLSILVLEKKFVLLIMRSSIKPVKTTIS